MAERTNAMLTETDREFLKGNVEYDSRQAVYNRRQSISEGIQQTLTDFHHIIDSSEFEVTEHVDFETRNDVIDRLAPLITVVDELAHNSGVSLGEVVREGEVNDREGDLNELSRLLVVGGDPDPGDFMTIIELLQSQPNAFAEIFPDHAPKIESVRNDRGLTATEQTELTHELAQREITDLWKPILEARNISWDKETLEDLKERTKRARKKRVMKEEIGEQVAEVSQNRDVTSTKNLNIVGDTDDLD
jgi:hypothetical protein